MSREKGKGGRPPRSLVALHYLLEREPLASNRVLAERLGVKVETLYTYKGRLQRNFVDIDKICPECFEESIVRDEETGERVCRRCGLVVGEYLGQLSDDLPFDTTYALTNHLAFGKSLGGTLPRKQLYKVLALGPSGTKDLPIRSTQIQVMSSAVEPPVVKAMLSYGSMMLKELGLDRDEDTCHVLSDEYGKCVRTVAAFLQVSRVKVQPHLVARAALYHILIQLYPEKAEAARWRFPFQEHHLELVEQLALLARRVETKPSRRRPPS